MKKLFCLSLFIIGAFTIIQAQNTLTFSLTNASSTDTWFYKMRDANGNTLSTVTIAPNSTIAGTLPGAGTFSLPITWKAEDSNGCGTSGTIAASPSGPVYPAYPCTSPSAMKYRISPTSFANDHFLEFKFD